MTTRPRIVIVGAGFAGLEAAKALANEACDVLVIDRQNHHVFQPLLYQVAMAGLSPANIASPIRKVLRNAQNVRVILDEVVGVDRASRRVLTKGGSHQFDDLIICTGAKTSYFGKDEWAQTAPGLKTIQDATHVRARILEAFEKAEMSGNQEPWLTFVVVGGGPTGVELAGSIAELSRRALARDFRSFEPSLAKVVLLEGGDRLLPSLTPNLSARAVGMLEALGVNVRVNTFVTDINEAGVTTSQGRIESRTVLWAAGVRSTPAAEWLGVEPDDQGRVRVTPCLHLQDDEHIYVCGDCASIAGPDGRPLPGVCQPAMQAGRYVGHRILGKTQGPFTYRDKGTMATIGRKMAVCKIGRFEFSGFIAWILWLFVHITYLVGFRNKLLTLIDWAWAYVTYERGARLIIKD